MNKFEGKTIEFLLGQINNADANTRAAAIWAIRDTKEVYPAELARQIIAAYQIENCNYVKQMYFTLFRNFLPQDAQVAKFLAESYPREDDKSVREAIVSAVHDLQDKNTCYDDTPTWNVLKKLVIDALRDNHYWVRHQAAKALGDGCFKGVDVESALVSALSDPAVSVRQCSAYSLCMWRGPGISFQTTVNALLHVAEEPADRSVAAPSAAAALSQAPQRFLNSVSSRIHTLLQSCLAGGQNSHEEVAYWLVCALGNLGSSSKPYLDTMKSAVSEHNIGAGGASEDRRKELQSALQNVENSMK